jgi:predicted RNA-binding Zn ribbon-like protein
VPPGNLRHDFWRLHRAHGNAQPDPASAARSEPDYRFDFCGGHLAVDFTNTVGSRGGASSDHLNTFGDLVAWAEARALASRRAAAALRRAAAADPEAARRDLRRARELREAIYRVFAAVAANRDPAPADLDAVNRFVRSAYDGSAVVSPSHGRFVLETPAGEGVDAVLRPIVRAAVDLLTSADLARVGMCADRSCGWLFIDTTRSHSRRWCAMKDCGNRNKVRRFRESSAMRRS